MLYMFHAWIFCLFTFLWLLLIANALSFLDLIYHKASDLENRNLNELLIF